MNQYYQAFGLQIASCISLPELTPSNISAGSEDVSIQFGDTPDQLTEIKTQGVTYQASPNQFLLKLENIASYWVREGKEIIITPNPKATEEDLRLFLLGSALGAILHQRNTLILHASAVVIDQEAVLFTGISGVGKSTTANTFRLAGHQLITDDVCPIHFDPESKRAMAIPGYPQSKLWEDSLTNLNVDFTDLKRIRNKINKRAVPLGDAFHAQPAPIKAIYFLNTHNQEEVLLEPIKAAQKFNIIKKMTYRTQFLKGLGVQKSHFQQGMQLAQKVPVKRITRPTTRFCAHEIIELVKKDLQS